MDWLALLIPLAPFALGGLWIWTRHQAKMVDKQKELILLGKNAPESEDGRRMNEDMKYLKERVATLEKIVTDERSTRELNNEIAKLKDS